ncbi:MAG: hypothetical protein ACREBG_19730 [Pyrinomonadaceae bacterium]
MARLRTLWVIHTTSAQGDANTDERFRMIIKDSSAQRTELVLPSLQHDERERGRTDEYVFNLEGGRFIEMETLRPADIGIEITGGNAWLPKSIWVIGQDVQGGRKLLAAQPSWPSDGWFSTQTSDAGARAKPVRFMG